MSDSTHEETKVLRMCRRGLERVLSIFSPGESSTKGENSKHLGIGSCDGASCPGQQSLRRRPGRSDSAGLREADQETARGRNIRPSLSEEHPEQSYYRLQTENAKFREEAIQLRREHDELQAENRKLQRIEGACKRRIGGLLGGIQKLETERGELQKNSGLLNTTIAGVRGQNESLRAAIKGFKEGRRLLDGRIRELGEENENVRGRNAELWSWGTQLQNALKEVQEREYAATKQQDIESHEAVSAQFGDLFRRCERWARRYFKLGVGDFRIEEFPPFAHEFELVSWSDVNWKDKKHFKVNHLVQAVLGNILVREVFKCPFAGCARDFRREFGHLYDVKLGVEGELAAHRWRASSLTTYYQCANWPPVEGPPIETYRTDHLKKIGDLLCEVLLPITNKYFLDQTAAEINSRGDQLIAIINDAIALATKMSQQASKLIIMDKEWFESNGRQLARNDDRMKDRLGDGDDNPEADLMVDLILTPGFLKYGNDDAEHLDQYSVWMPAKVDIRDPLGGNPPPTSGETQANGRVEVGNSQDFTPDPPTDTLEDRSGNELLDEEANKSDETL